MQQWARRYLKPFSFGKLLQSVLEYKPFTQKVLNDSVFDVALPPLILYLGFLFWLDRLLDP